MISIDLKNPLRHLATNKLPGWRQHFDGSTLVLRRGVGDDLIDNSLAADCSEIRIQTDRIIISRGSSGEQPIFLWRNSDRLLVGANANEIAETVEARIDVLSAYSFIYFEYPGPRRSLFHEVRQLMNGEALEIEIANSQFSAPQILDNFKLPCDELQNRHPEQLAQILRDHITRAHERRAGSDPLILLSGGVDSQVMSIAMVRDAGRSNVAAATFFVEGARSTEVEDARQVARNLGLDWQPIGIDPNTPIDLSEIAETGFPYLGQVIFERMYSQLGRVAGSTVLSGQDTRLHTPALGSIDLKIWRYLFSNSVLPSLSKMAGVIGMPFVKGLDLSNLARRKIEMLAQCGQFSDFAQRRYFKFREFQFNRSDTLFETIENEIKHSLQGIDPRCPRSAYNQIVHTNWRWQYAFDIGYCVETGQRHGLNVQLPFYDTELSNFSARLPFDLATRIVEGRAGHGQNPVRVNKYLLRLAYKGELDDSLIFRDKAVCPTHYMFMNGGLKNALDSFIHDQRLHESDLAQTLHLPELRDIAASRHGKWQEKDNWICNLVINAMIVWHHIQK